MITRTFLLHYYFKSIYFRVRHMINIIYTNGLPIVIICETCTVRLFITPSHFLHDIILPDVCENQTWREHEKVSLFEHDTIVSGVDVVAAAVESCGPSEATCSNKQCIPKSKVCDGEVDCSDGSDETRCSTSENSLAVLNSKKKKK